MEDVSSWLLEDTLKSNVSLKGKYASTHDLMHRKLDTLDGLLDALKKLTQMSELNLADNLLVTLPADLSGLSKVSVLHLNNNPLTDMTAALAALQTLPSLRQLFITLRKKEQAQLVLYSLPKLTILNGQRISLALPA